jgi:flagellar biosynthesis protein FlhG
MRLPTLTAIGSGKGGTGKTLAATALASALAQTGERVLLCDADLGLANTAVHLGLSSGGSLAGFLSEQLALEEAVVPVQGGLGTRGGFDLIAAPPGSGAFANLDRAVAERLIAKLRLASSYDRVLLDLSAGVDATTMGFAARSHQTILVQTADPAALTDAYAFVKLLLRLGGPFPFTLINNVGSEAEAKRTRDALAKTCQAFLKMAPDYLGFVPRDPHAAAAIRQQRPLVALYPEAPSTRAFRDIARRINDSALSGPSFADTASLR